MLVKKKERERKSGNRSTLSHKFLVIEASFLPPFCLCLIDIFVSAGMSTLNFMMYHGLKKIEFNKGKR